MSRIEDVAKKAGVSIATVSRVINNSGNVSEKTKMKVWKAIKELNYKPKILASALARHKEKFYVGICKSNRLIKMEKEKTSPEFYSVILEALEEVGKTYGIKFEKMDIQKPEKCDGYILVGGDSTKEIINFYRELEKPFLLLDHYIPGEKIDCIVTNGYDGAYFVTNYLIKKGFKKIYHIHGPLYSYGFKSRFEGYRNAMEDANLIPRFFEYDDVNDNMSEVINSIDIPEAIFASNDITAMRIIRELRKRNIRVPEDVSVIGFDDILSAKDFDPPLTTLKVFKDEMGSLAAKRIYELLVGHDVHPILISLFTKFIKRKSSI
ncbi:LacI family transcriptional regulator [Thermosipho melanesiensis]|uniref:Regulatory protein, LacI n=2 Tax=Thermosipho melanesiensis TaxID=46541 RepID=A6LL25_THEM4|nr:LacI family DNA-binding transcriptional regulator [Thermosipho melanesiensis]ABR30626.1 regulatory protein, LacI [Thermosipho melanesiensis BI429]APT73766.1 LacI family transcriptional regulator [Thermosipho melanesiensis]OOC35706.1 LacI family transcriptional regulator [Thermosipho melanesiensis]OOC39005.1 LacI family transcriptional regulator [Thermosipho melanesiensis]OOC39153.1 LacI family transcriptional regulator [Thermosipho melanesiensis]